MTEQEAIINEQANTIAMLRAVVERTITPTGDGPIPTYLLAAYAVLTDVYHYKPEAQNFLGLGWTWTDGEQEEHYSVTIQRTGGETPAAMAVRMKRENAALRAEIEALKAAK